MRRCLGSLSRAKRGTVICMKPYTPQDGKIWASAVFPVCTLSLPVAELAARVGLPLNHWDEDGMGNASGFCGQLAAV